MEKFVILLVFNKAKDIFIEEHDGFSLAIDFNMSDKEKVISSLEKSLKHDLSFRHAFLEGAFTVPGDGCIDYKPILNELKKNNYNGWLVVEAEQDPKKANPFKYAKIGYNYLRSRAKECGFFIID